ncbi:MAG TPA: FMN-binding negative transcriptional regulator [Dyella sp.]|uniref:FMN-binding negative transcriptional regulator n=1 Tax=Dyella sp. TaxID=1869338 RepID=UPI002F93F38E
MYTPGAFAESRSEVLHALMRAHPFATAIVPRSEGVAVNHLPFELIDGKLCGHVARGNEMVACDGLQALLVFHGPQGYVSPNWYPSKRETGREVPTWNYAVVHVHGRLRVIDERKWLRGLLDALTSRHEADQPEPWRIDEAPADHIERLLGAIVGLQLDIDRIEGKYKLSQNHPADNRLGVIDGLCKRNAPGDAALADLMHATEEAGDEC